MPTEPTTHRRAETLRAVQNNLDHLGWLPPGGAAALNGIMSLLRDYDARLTELERRQDAAREVM